MSYKDGKRYHATYWNGEGKHQEMYDNLWQLLVPARGEANTMEGEMLRIAGNFYYDRYNNGHCNPCRTKPAQRVRDYMRRNKLNLWSDFKVNVSDWLLDEAMDQLIAHIISRPTFKKRKPREI
jgi:hypothetical protein